MRNEKRFAPIVQLKPERLDEAARKEVAALSPDLLVSFAYGRLFGPRFLSLFPLGGINIHPSLLPKYRGASPIPAAILAGEAETGICIQKLAAKLDSGDILESLPIELSETETTLTLSETMSQKAARLLESVLLDFDSKAASARPQEGEASYCGEIKKEAGRIDWTKSADVIDAQIRAYTPWPLSFTRRGSETLFILEAEPFWAETPEKAMPGTVLDLDGGVLIQTGDGILAATRLQWQTKKAMNWKDFFNGARDFVGSRLE